MATRKKRATPKEKKLKGGGNKVQALKAFTLQGVASLKIWIALSLEKGIHQILIEDIEEAKKLYGQGFDVEFITKVDPLVHFEIYLERYIDAPNDAYRQRYAWRIWQCIEMVS